MLWVFLLPSIRQKGPVDLFWYFVPYLLHLVPKTARNNNHVIVMTTGNDTLKRRESQRREKENDQC